MCVSERERERERMILRMCAKIEQKRTRRRRRLAKNICTRATSGGSGVCALQSYTHFSARASFSLSTDGGENTKLDTQTHFPFSPPVLRGNVSLRLVLNKRKTRIVPRRRGPAKNQATATREHVSARARALVPRCLIRLQTKGKRSTHTRALIEDSAPLCVCVREPFAE